MTTGTRTATVTAKITRTWFIYMMKQKQNFFSKRTPIEREGREESREVRLTKNKSRILTALTRMKKVEKFDIQKISINCKIERRFDCPSERPELNWEIVSSI
uniref:Uncharacterized protein n=1 Tax=Vespula pensylvanica TaxID=30213 RepID=A0A834PFM1_VESPE|nr:hypothetical protein H0235_001180 [Vespula pensylvanica]